MGLAKLPIGIQTFKNIREDNYIYIDKTDVAFELVNNYKYAFLSRPRRFGKSLFLDTLHNIFEAKKELFIGLAIYDKWDWSVSYPVIKISWAGSDYEDLDETKNKAFRVLKENQKRLQIECDLDATPAGCLEILIQEAYEKYNQKVVVLVDEYDKPILNNIEDKELALKNRNFLRGFYEVLKENDAYIKFAFLTGISKFSKANIFSGLNNLEDISLTPAFATICGYTQKDIENEFLPYLEGKTDLELVKRWYNGYNFMGENVYNPFDILKFIKNGYMFKNYWWESGNPSFLITLLQQQTHYNIPNMENMVIGDELLNSFEIEKLRLEVLLFQSGYLTIESYYNNPNFGISEYKLKVPNLEVQISLNKLFLDYLTDQRTTNFDLIKALQNADIEGFRDVFTSLFASIPYNNYTNNKIYEYEGYYASVFYAYLAASGLDIRAEDTTNLGRIDITIKIENYIYIIEFKVRSDTDALEQIKEKNYAQKYQNENKEIYLVGITFDNEKRNISTCKYEKIKVIT